MRKLLLIAVFLVAGLFASTTFAQGGGWHQHNGHWHNHYHTRYHYHNVGYYPVVQWFPTGTSLNVGPVVVSPDRRYVRFGINASFSSIRGYSTFNYRTGQSRYYPYPPRR